MWRILRWFYSWSSLAAVSFLRFVRTGFGVAAPSFQGNQWFCRGANTYTYGGMFGANPTRGEEKTNPPSQSAGRNPRRPDRGQCLPGSAASSGRLNPLSGVGLFGGFPLSCPEVFRCGFASALFPAVFCAGFVFWVSSPIGLV